MPTTAEKPLWREERVALVGFLFLVPVPEWGSQGTLCGATVDSWPRIRCRWRSRAVWECLVCLIGERFVYDTEYDGFKGNENLVGERFQIVTGTARAVGR